jgi:hypothetical protein
MVLSHCILTAVLWLWVATAAAEDGRASVAGTIAASGGGLAVSEADGATVRLALTADSRIMALSRHEFAEIAAGTVVCAASVVAPDGPALAMVVQILPDGAADPAHPPCAMFGGSLTVAGPVERVTRGQGYPTLAIAGPGGSTLVVVAPGTPVVTVEPGDAALLVPGAPVLAVGTRSGDGTLAVERITVGRDGALPGI